jgi:hypothetical protein
MTGTWVVGSNATVLLLAWRVLSWVNSQFKERDLRIEAAHALAKLTEEVVRKEFNDYKLHVAERYATKDGVNDGMARLEKGLSELKDLINQMLLEERRDRERT